jgi:hypothetical protein
MADAKDNELVASTEASLVEPKAPLVVEKLAVK